MYKALSHETYAVRILLCVAAYVVIQKAYHIETANVVFLYDISMYTEPML